VPQAPPTFAQRVALARTGAAVVGKLGARTIGHAAAASLRAALARRRQGGPAGARPGIAPGPLRDVEVLDTGARLFFEHAELELVFLAEDVVRRTWQPGRMLPHYALAGDPGFAPPAVTVRRDVGTAGGWVVAGPSLVVRVAPDGALSAERADGTVLRRDAPPEHLDPGWTAPFTMRAGERFHGLGVRAAPLDLRGGVYRLWNRDPGGAWGPGRDPLYMSVPVLVGRHAEGTVLTFFENPTKGRVDLRGRAADSAADSAVDGTDVAAVSFAGGALRSYLVVGDVPSVLDRYSALTGRPALPPRWALGYHQSRWGYRDDKEIRDVVEGFAAMGVPLSVVHLDIDHMDGFRVFTVDPTRFGDIGALSEHAGRHGVRVVTIVDPGVKIDDRFELYAEGRRDFRFCMDEHGGEAVGVVWPGRAAFPDFTDPDTRAWWAARYAWLTDRGIAGIWHDMNEPATIAFMGDPTLPMSTRHNLDGIGGDHCEAHNVYGLLMNRAGWEGLRAAYPDRRPFIVSRSGWAGTQRYAWNWTADVQSTWDGLRQQVSTLLGLGLSGVPFSGSDIGGFSGIVPDDELYLRWLQFAVFVPFCRTHGVVGSPPREPWHFPPPTAAALAAWIRFRYRLLPYLYTLAHEAAATGVPPMRPLWWPGDGDVGDEPAAEVDDSFLLGDALLVAPVVRAGQRARALSLPPGAWASLWAGPPAHPAAATPVRLSAPIGRIPVLVRRGSIVPLDDGWSDPASPCAVEDDHRVDASARTTGLESDHRAALLAFHCWPDAGGDASGLCIDDAGDGEGPVRRDELRLEGAVPGGEAVLRWTRRGDHPAPARVRVVLHGLVPERASADGRELRVDGGSIESGPFDELRLTGLQGRADGPPAPASGPA